MSKISPARNIFIELFQSAIDLSMKLKFKSYIFKILFLIMFKKKFET